MLTEAKNQIKISFLSIKYALAREMLNKASFISNIIFMIFNNASFIIEWVIFYSLKDNFGGYTFNMVLLLWGLSSTFYGFSHFFFKDAFSLYKKITDGSLDSYLVQPKSVLLTSITSNIEPSAIGDILFGYIMLIVYGLSIKNFALFTLFAITGALIEVSIAIIFSSLSFWIIKSDSITDTATGLMVSFSTYPDGIFKGVTKILLYILIPVGITTYIPVKVITNFDIRLLLIVVLVTVLLVIIAFEIFNKGLKKYSSTNLMNARV